jgi:dUTP pyrophosphatase
MNPQIPDKGCLLVESEILFAAIKPGAIIPTKRDGDAGYDVYALLDESYIVIAPHQTVIIPTGIVSAFPEGYVALLQERGSTGTKGIGQRAGVIDSSYRGEWMVPITNHSPVPLYLTKPEADIQLDVDNRRPSPVIYYTNKAISQAVFLPIAKLHARETIPEEVYAVVSERKDGRLGSSGK